jgi:hypothetical protein
MMSVETQFKHDLSNVVGKDKLPTLLEEWMLENMDLTRLKKIIQKDKERNLEYAKALNYLNDV